MALEAGAGRLQGSRRLIARRNIAVAAIVAGIVIGAFFAIKGLGGGDETKGGQLKGSSKGAFTLSYPQSWRPLSRDDLDKLPGNPLAVVRRKDGKGFLVLRRENRAPKSFSTFSGDLTKALDKRIPDFQKRSSRTIKIRAGNAFFYSYIRKSKGTVHTVVVVPAGKRSYVLNTVSRGGAQDVARQIASIILSFKT
jgi:hypothetical protein